MSEELNDASGSNPPNPGQAPSGGAGAHPAADFFPHRESNVGLARLGFPLANDPPSSEGVGSEQPGPLATVEIASEEEIAAGIVFLKARAAHFGDSGLPLAVRLANGAPAGWRRASLEWIAHNKLKASTGESPRLGGVTTGLNG